MENKKEEVTSNDVVSAACEHGGRAEVDLPTAATNEQCAGVDTSRKVATISGEASPETKADEDKDEESTIWYPEDYKPVENDVVCGRKNHPNVKFRKLIRDYMYEYANAIYSKTRKAELVSKILNQLVFIKMDESKLPRRYRRISDASAREKIGQALRDKLAQPYRSSNRTRLSRLQQRRLMPFDFEPRDSDIAISDEQRESHPGMPALDARIQEMMSMFSSATLSEQEALVSKLYQEFNEQGRSFLHRRAHEDYRWHRMSECTSKIEIYRLFQSKIDALNLKKQEHSNDTVASNVKKRKCTNEQLWGEEMAFPTRSKTSGIDKRDSQHMTGRCGLQVNDQLECNNSLCSPKEGPKAEKQQNTFSNKEINALSYPEGVYYTNLELQAHQGNADAQYELGVATLESADYTTDYGDPERREEHRKLQLEAVKWFQCAASQGHANAQFTLAQFYHDGVGMKQNLEKAAELYYQAAAQFHVLAGNEEVPDAFFLTSRRTT